MARWWTVIYLARTKLYVINFTTWNVRNTTIHKHMKIPFVIRILHITCSVSIYNIYFTQTLLSVTFHNTCYLTDNIDDSKENFTRTSSHNTTRETVTGHTSIVNLTISYFDGNIKYVGKTAMSIVYLCKRILELKKKKINRYTFHSCSQLNHIHWAMY